MTEKKWGRIVNIASSSAHNGFKNAAIYCSSKHALLGLSRTLFVELKDNKPEDKKDKVENSKKELTEVKEIEETIDRTVKSLDITEEDQNPNSKKKRFYSPLVKSIAKKENISIKQLDSIEGSEENRFWRLV